ncbi:MAG: hypothetical protein U0X92_00860 [Anaerolineales bacterium]
MRLAFVECDGLDLFDCEGLRVSVFGFEGSVAGGAARDGGDVLPTSDEVGLSAGFSLRLLNEARREQSCKKKRRDR